MRGFIQALEVCSADELWNSLAADDAQAHGDEQHEVVCSDKGDMDGSSESGDVDIVDDVSPSGQEEQQHDEDVSTLIQPHESNPTASADGRSDAHVAPQGVQGAAAMDGGREHGVSLFDALFTFMEACTAMRRNSAFFTSLPMSARGCS